MQLGIFTSTLCGDHKEMGIKSVMHVQRYSFAEKTYCFLAFLSGRFISNNDSDGNEIVNLKEKPCRFFCIRYKLMFSSIRFGMEQSGAPRRALLRARGGSAISESI